MLPRVTKAINRIIVLGSSRNCFDAARTAHIATDTSHFLVKKARRL